jgi:hypothetical protein
MIFYDRLINRAIKIYARYLIKKNLDIEDSDWRPDRRRTFRDGFAVVLANKHGVLAKYRFGPDGDYEVVNLSAEIAEFIERRKLELQGERWDRLRCDVRIELIEEGWKPEEIRQVVVDMTRDRLESVQHEIDAQIEAEIEAMYRPPDLDGPVSAIL